MNRLAPVFVLTFAAISHAQDRDSLALVEFAQEPEEVRVPGRFEFPEGVPLRAADVHWYFPTNHYQLGGGVHDRRFNVSSRDPFGNGNREFPWKTGGMDQSTNGASYLFYRFPPGSEIVRWNEGNRVRWRYPEGTIFGEVLTVDGRCFEVRVMTRGRSRFDFQVFRPFASASEFAGELVSHRQSVGRLRDKHSGTVVNEVALTDEIELPAQTVQDVLSRPFRDVTGVPWAKKQGSYVAYAPVSAKRGQLTPVGYQGHFFGKDTCAKCHDTVGRNVRAFETSRSWYGDIRGSDGVFSFSIFEDASRNGATRPVRFRSDLPLVRR